MEVLEEIVLPEVGPLAVNSCDFLLSSGESLALLRDAAETEPRVRHDLFTPFGGSIGRALDQRLDPLPLGGQYAAWVRRPAPNGG